LTRNIFSPKSLFSTEQLARRGRALAVASWDYSSGGKRCSPGELLHQLARRG